MRKKNQNKNKYYYTIIRYVPDKLAGEFVNIGFIIGTDEMGWDVEYLQNEDHVKAFDYADLYPEVKKHVKEQFEEDHELSEEFLQNYNDKFYRDAVELSRMSIILEDSLYEAKQTIRNSFLVE